MIPHPHQRLSYQISTQPNSSFASHEDLQCNWSESRQSISEAATPREHRPGETGDVIGQTLPQDSYCQAYLDMPVTSKAKALSLRELVRLKNIGRPTKGTLRKVSCQQDTWKISDTQYKNKFLFVFRF
jgi:hypothetical protein